MFKSINIHYNYYLEICLFLEISSLLPTLSELIIFMWSFVTLLDDAQMFLFPTCVVLAEQVEDEEEFMTSDPRQARGNRPVFECYWNGRLIPYTTIDE